MTLTILLPLSMVLICCGTLYGCYRAFDALQTRAETMRGGRRWMAILMATGVGLIALLSFWCCFVFSLGFFQAVGLNLR